jgi:branched-chain amino acid transport system permease protein
MVLADVLVVYAVVQWLWPSPVGVLLKGAVIGGLTALIAFGIALTYRSNRVINFAQGDLGGIPAALGALLVLSSGMPYLVAVPAVLLVAVALGALVEFVFIRRFFTAPRLILTVVTIGLSQILAGVATALPQLFGQASPQNVVPPPVDIEFVVTGVVFNANELIAMATVPLVIAAVALFLRKTDIGVAIRAAAQSPDRAALLGVPIKRVQMVVWVLTTVLASIAIFLRAGILGLPIGSVLGPTVLVRALAACVIGRMERMTVIVGASVGLGIVESAIIFSTGRSQLVDPILFLVIVGALLLQSRSSGRREDADASAWSVATCRRWSGPAEPWSWEARSSCSWCRWSPPTGSSTSSASSSSTRSSASRSSC